MKVLLNCFPPTDVISPDLGLSVLKQYLSNKEIECDILYWNILLFDYSMEIVPNNISSDIAGIFLPYIFCLENGYNDNMGLFLQFKNPSWSILGADYYKKYISETADNIKKCIKETIFDRNLKSYDIIGISYKYSQWIPAIVFIRELKKKNPEFKTIIGCIPSMIEAQKIMETFHDDIDYAIWGEGEIALYKLVDFLQVNNNTSTVVPNDIHSLVYMHHGKIITNTSRPLYSEMVIPDFSDFMNQYKDESYPPILNIETSRGCYWNKCKFCYMNEGYSYRRKTNEQVIQSIDSAIKKHNINRLVFSDNDVCGANIIQFESLLDSIISYKKNNEVILLSGEFNSKKLNKNIIEKISLAGFEALQIGIESISDRKLKKIDKHASFINHLLSIKFCCKYGLIIKGSNLITGFFDDDIQDVIESVNNLHYLRFYFKLGFHFRFPHLHIKATSQYYPKMAEKEQDRLYSDIAFMITDESILKNKLYFFEHSNLYDRNSGLWGYFNDIYGFYSNSVFTYHVSQQKASDSLYFIYTECFNDKQILNLVFNELEWSIIEECSNNIIKIEALISKITNKYADVLPASIREIIEELNKERLVYIDYSTEEVFCIIDLDILDK